MRPFFKNNSASKKKERYEYLTYISIDLNLCSLIEFDKHNLKKKIDLDIAKTMPFQTHSMTVTAPLEIVF